MTVPSIDSGVFLYDGQQILNGKLPYRDFWDHKPPLVFYLNALILKIYPEGWWGIWWFQVLWGTLGAYLCYSLLKEQIPMPLAALVSSGSIMLFHHFGGSGNFTEFYAIIFFYLAFISFLKIRSEENIKIYSFILGLSFALSFMFRQNSISTWLSIGIFFSVEFILDIAKNRIKDFIPAVFGSLIGLFFVLLPFILEKSLVDFWDVAFAYQFIYIKTDLLDKLITLKQFLIMMFTTSFFTGFTMVLWIIGSIYVIFHFATWKKTYQILSKLQIIFIIVGFLLISLPIFHFNRKNFVAAIIGICLTGFEFCLFNQTIKNKLDQIFLKKTTKSFLFTELELVALLSFLFEMIMIVLSARPFIHYYFMIIPASCVVLGAGIRIACIFSQKMVLPSSKIKLFNNCGYTILLFSILIIPLINWIKIIQTPFPLESHNVYYAQSIATRYIQENIEPNQKVQIWGNVWAAVNFASDRESPTKYSYVTPLYSKGYCTDLRIHSFIEELKNNQPNIIINPNNLPYVFALPSQIDQINPYYLEQPCVQQLAPLFEYIDNAYFLADTIELIDWDVYMLRE
jgi:hypothetical protein